MQFSTGAVSWALLLQGCNFSVFIVEVIVGGGAILEWIILIGVFFYILPPLFM